MALQLETGYEFELGEQNVTHTKLNNAVNLATAVAGSIAAVDCADDFLTKDKLNSNVAGSGLAQDTDGSLKVVGFGFTTTALTNANVALARGTSTKTQKFTGTLTGPVVINLSRTNAVAGDLFRIKLSGIVVDGTNTLTIQENGTGALVVFQDASFPNVNGTLDFEFNGTSWEITLQMTQES
jgi:hypothetical protein